jgi:hypothetical protein
MMGGLQEATLDGERLGLRDLLRRGMALAVNGVVMAGHHHAPLFTLARGQSSVWMLHCHVLEHHAGGMGGVFRVT